MRPFEAARLPVEPDALAPDGSAVRTLLRLDGGSMSHCDLPGGRTSAAVAHRTVEELWFILGGRGEMWRRQGEREEVVVLVPGVCLSIPRGTHFQFRAFGEDALRAVAVTMPPWPGDDEALAVPGPWAPGG